MAAREKLIAIVPVTRKRVKMATYWGKRGILHFSYLLNEFGDSNFFFLFLLWAYQFLFPEQLLMDHLNEN